MVATDYNTAVMGSIEFMIGYDGNIIPPKEIIDLLDVSIAKLNASYKALTGDSLEIHFHLDNIEDETWHELNGFVQLAYRRRNDEMPPVSVVYHYLTTEELARFNLLTERLSKERSNDE